MSKKMLIFDYHPSVFFEMIIKAFFRHNHDHQSILIITVQNALH